MFTDTIQVSMVVRDLDATVRTLIEDYGLGPWNIFEIGPEMPGVSDLVHNDEPAEFKMRIATSNVGQMEWEFIQPLEDSGPYAEFLATKGEGIHHLCVLVNDYDEAVDRLREKGHIAIMGGKLNGARLMYASTDRDFHAITEIVDMKALTEMPAPIEVRGESR